MNAAPLTRETPTISKDEYGATLFSAYGHEVSVENNRKLVRINAPSFYTDPHFLAWLNNPEAHAATWHTRGAAPSESSDVFIHHGGAHWTPDGELNADGSDYYLSGKNQLGLPEPIVAAITEAVTIATGNPDTECLVWISNLN